MVSSKKISSKGSNSNKGEERHDEEKRLNESPSNFFYDRSSMLTACLEVILGMKTKKTRILIVAQNLTAGKFALKKMRVRPKKSRREHLGLSKLHISCSLYDRVLSCRLYRLENKSHIHSFINLGKVKDFMLQMKIPLRKIFQWWRLYQDFGYLGRLFRELDVQGMSRGQVLVAFPVLLTGFV